MTQAPAAISKIPTESPQPTPRRAVKSPGRPRKAPGTGRSSALAGGTGRAARAAYGLARRQYGMPGADLGRAGRRGQVAAGAGVRSKSSVGMGCRLAACRGGQYCGGRSTRPGCPKPSPRTSEKITGRLIVRRVRARNDRAAEGMDELFPVWRYHAVFSDSPFELAQAEGQHRDHAIVEQVIADLYAGPLAHLPSGHGRSLVLAQPRIGARLA
jgi:hypothetical protein